MKCKTIIKKRKQKKRVLKRDKIEKGDKKMWEKREKEKSKYTESWRIIKEQKHKEK